MRNLGLLSSTAYTLPAGQGKHVVAATALDLDENALFFASEDVSEADVNIAVWRVDEQDQPRHVANLTSPVVEDVGAAAQVVSLAIIPDTRVLCVITRSGDIATLSLDLDLISGSSHQLEVVGTITPGNVLAASFAPDSSLLALVTSVSNPSLILMDPFSFDVISSSALHTADYGEDQPVNVGWGSKSTQFHGSLGKSAAQTKTEGSYGTTSPDDDGAPYISWRGDAQYFAVSSVQGRKRVLRVYNRLAALQSTAEDVPGLEHVLAWRPSGGLIAGTQRFGSVPLSKVATGVQSEESRGAWALGKGRDGRHDIIFFERNGLRHGEFSLREHGAGGLSRGPGEHAKSPVDRDQNPVKPLRLWGYRVRELAWNADSSILSVWVERDAGDVVQLWTTGNYHWYLKLEIPVPDVVNGRFKTVSWHAEDPTRLILSTSTKVIDMQCLVYTAVSALNSPDDTGLVAVIDGSHILLTPFRTQNVPPPMASHRLDLAFSPTPSDAVSSQPSPVLNHTPQSHPPPIHISFAPTAFGSSDLMAALFVDGSVAVWEMQVRLEQKKGRREAVMPRILWWGVVGEPGKHARQVFLIERGEAWLVGALGESEDHEDILSINELARKQDGLNSCRSWHVCMPGRNGRLATEHGGRASVVWQGNDGRLWEVRLTDENQSPKVIARLPEFCDLATRVFLPPSSSDSLIVGLSSSVLYITSTAPPSPSGVDPPPSSIAHPRGEANRSTLRPVLALSRTCTSFTITGSYSIWTATAPAHEAVFAKLITLQEAILRASAVPPSAVLPAELQSSFERRRIERGARIVTAVPSAMSLVLQTPRGNLETVMPRPLVMEQVHLDVQRGDYRAAFLACRKHRVDLNVIVELNLTAFVKSIESFVEQLDDVDHINLFLSGLSRSSLPSETINKLCDDIRTELERRDVKKFVNSILTAHVVKSPPDYEAGLSLLLRLRETDSELVEDAVKYIIFLVDADRLFDTALGMYDFSLVLLVAQHSQKDPREYLPFLRSLRALDGPYQKFKIDDHLKRHRKALQSLHHAGDDKFEEAKFYTEKHRLYIDALAIWEEEKPNYDAMLELYGDYLFERREFQSAALAFAQSSRTRKAMVAYEKALQWQELFDLLLRENVTCDEIADTARRVADDLASKQRHAEAARVLLDYVDDVDEAVASLVRGSEWSEACRIATLRKRGDLVTSLIFPGTLEACASVSEEVGEIQDLLDKQIGRLDELAAKKISEPDAFYGIEDANLANVDVMTDVSNPGTMFTRYTVAPTTSDRSRRTSRSKRKLDRKAGRKGTVEEEEYLLKSLTKLVTRLEAAQAEARALLPHLLVLSDEHAQEGRELQDEVEVLEQAIHAGIERIWAEREQASLPQTGAADQIEETPNNVKLTEKVPKPVFSNVPWKIGWMKAARD